MRYEKGPVLFCSSVIHRLKKSFIQCNFLDLISSLMSQSISLLLVQTNKQSSLELLCLGSIGCADQMDSMAGLPTASFFAGLWSWYMMWDSYCGILERREDRRSLKEQDSGRENTVGNRWM